MAPGTRLRRRRADNPDDRPLRILFLNWRDLDHPEGGGSELFVQTVAAELAAAGHAVTFFCAAHAGAPTTESRNGYRIVRGGGHLGVYPSAALAWWTRRLGIADVIVDVQNGVPFFARLWSRSPVVLLVHHVHRELWPVVMSGRRAKVGWWIESRLSPRVHRGCQYVTVSKATHDELTGLGVSPSRITVVHNGTPSRDVVEARGETPEICVLGRLVPHKRVEHAIRAVATIRRTRPTVRLTIVGAGYWEPNLRALVKDLDLAEAVTFSGHVDDETKHRLLARAWVLAMPSVKEGWALSVVEAASHGTPAIAYRSAGGVSESIIDGSTGLLVDTEEEFVSTLGTVLDDAQLRRRLGDAAISHAARFTWPAAAAAFESVLRAAAGEDVELESLSTDAPPAIEIPRQRVSPETGLLDPTGTSNDVRFAR
jgi:glycosyltransferase involved in cell wall biosynthesis